MKCRFNFPQDYQEQAKLQVDEENNVEFLPKRNDERLNKYNQYIIQTWRANIDVAPVLSKKALINYLAKYISKSEQKSCHLTELMNIINETVDKNKTAKHAVQRLYIKACAERDFSSQETCHLLMGLKLYSSGGREFVSIGFTINQEWRLLKEDNTGLSVMEKYQARSDFLDAKCLWYVAKCYHMPSEKLRKKEAIVQIYPKFQGNATDNQKAEKYYRQQVLLYVPWRNEDQLKGERNSWREVYEDYKEIIQLNAGVQCDLQGMEPTESDFEDQERNHYMQPEEWMVVSGMGPSQNIEEVSLGCREVDTTYDWHESLKLYDIYGGIPDLLTFINRMKTANKLSNRFHKNVLEVPLNEDQQRVMDLLQLQISSLVQPMTQHIPRTAIVQGKAGTGKSLLIAKMVELISATYGPDSFLILGPTGVSALNINGSTIHSKLLLKPNEDFFNLEGAELHNFIQATNNVKFVIIDEFSMVGCELLHTIDQRLRQAKQDPKHEFGGIFLYMFGDINQLPPVFDCSSYSDRQNTMEAIAGKILYDSIDIAFFLEKIHRQNDQRFQKILNNISSGNITKEDYEILTRRFTTHVSPQERKNFEDAPHFYPTNKEKDNFNYKILSNEKDPITNSWKPVARIPAKVSVKSSTNLEALCDTDDLETVLYLTKGSKVMLKMNLWTERGLVNGSLGVVVDILYDPDAIPQEDPPAVLICTFESYTGPYLDQNKMTVPIAPFQTVNNKAGKNYTVSQFPIVLSNACTIHKSQGLTVNKAYVNIGENERQAGLTYVALSRVKSLDGLLLEPFDFSRCMRINKSTAIARRQKWLESLRSKHYLV